MNDRPDLPLTDPQRKGFEQLLRKLLRLPGRPAVVMVRALNGGLWKVPWVGGRC